MCHLNLVFVHFSVLESRFQRFQKRLFKHTLLSFKNLTKNVAVKFCVCIFSFLESMAEDIGGVEAVLQEHLTFRRKKSSTIRARGETYTLKGTVRPDWICMRVVSLESALKGHQPLQVFNFFISLLNILKRLQSPEPLHAELNPILLLVRFTVCMCSSRDLFRQPYSINAGVTSTVLWIAA